MAVRHMIAAGIGFRPGSVKFIVTRGLGASSASDVAAMASYRKRRVRKPDDTQARLDAQRAELEQAQLRLEASRLEQIRLEAQAQLIRAEEQALAMLRAEIASEMQAIEIMGIVQAELQAQRDAEMMAQAQEALAMQKQQDFQMRVFLITKAMDEEV